MKEVWFAFRLVEGVLSAICMALHIHGFLHKEQPLNHEMYFCGTFFGFTCISIFTNLGTFIGAAAPLFLEAIISSFAFFFFLLCSVMSMHYAEKDYHLMYLSDFEEAIHPFFFINKCQSICSLVCATAYLLHATFATDALIITESPPELSSIRLVDNEAHEPIKLYLFCKPLFKYCPHSNCCKKLGRIIPEYHNEEKV